MDFVEAKGKTVDEAIFKGLEEMGPSLDEVEIDIVQEGGKGFLGLGKATVRLTKKEPESSGKSEPEQFLDGLFERMGVEAECSVTGEDEKSIRIEMTGKDTAVLIGRRGDTLDAIQYLTGLAVNKGREDYKKIMLDAENYRAKRERTLEKLAKRLANTVAKTGKPITLEPMNPYERRILHATLQSHPRVETISEGEEPYRRVVIRRKRREA